MQPPIDAGFAGNGDLAHVNPLFFSSQHPSPEDDQATISAPLTENNSPVGQR